MISGVCVSDCLSVCDCVCISVFTHVCVCACKILTCICMKVHDIYTAEQFLLANVTLSQKMKGTVALCLPDSQTCLLYLM